MFSSTITVLVIDDNPEQIRFISEILKSEGCKIYAAISCEDAFPILERHIPDLLILDIFMPGMDGFTFCSRIKHEKKWMDIPVIFATAYNDVENIGRSFAVGGSDYVVKPFIREELLERVKVRIKLSQQERQLKKAYEELDKFCYCVSHDIRSPLQVIKQLTGLLEAELEEGNLAEAEKICLMLTEKSGQAATMIEGLHRFSKVFSETMTCSRVDMNLLFEEVMEELKLLEKDRKIEFEKEKLPAVQGDEALLRLVVQNILGNALKFSRQREITRIRLTTAGVGNMAAFFVQDNGIGFDERNAGELFHVFRKLHNDPKYEGDGIGLASVKRILVRHGGDVEITSQLNIGTCVKFLLPLDK